MLDVQQIQEMMAASLSIEQRQRAQDIKRALTLVIDDIGQRLLSRQLVFKDTLTATAGSAEVTLAVSHGLLHYFSAMVISPATEDRRPGKYFKEDWFRLHYENPLAEAGKPEIFTIRHDETGTETLVFEYAFAAAETLEVWYYAQLSEGLLPFLPSVSAVVQGGLAYFFGLQTEEGIRLYGAYEKLLKIIRANQGINAAKTARIVMGAEDQEIMDEINSFKE